MGFTFSVTLTIAAAQVRPAPNATNASVSPDIVQLDQHEKNPIIDMDDQVNLFITLFIHFFVGIVTLSI
jgi:hypothetical protein